MSNLVCSQCGQPFEKVEINGEMVDFPFPEDMTQDDINFMNMVCGRCTPKRMVDLKGEKFEKLERTGSALTRLSWLYRDEYEENEELELFMRLALIFANSFEACVERIEQLDREKCRRFHKLCWPGEKENQNEG